MRLWIVLCVLLPAASGSRVAFELLRSMRDHGESGLIWVVESDSAGTSLAAAVSEGVLTPAIPYQPIARGKIDAMRANIDLREWEGKSVARRFLHFVRTGCFPIAGGVVLGDPEKPDGWLGISGKATGQEDEEIVIRWAKETNQSTARYNGWLNIRNINTIK